MPGASRLECNSRYCKMTSSVTFPDAAESIQTYIRDLRTGLPSRSGHLARRRSGGLSPATEHAFRHAKPCSDIWSPKRCDIGDKILYDYQYNRPCLRQTSTVGIPASCPVIIPIICASLKRLFRICLFLQWLGRLYTKSRELPGGRSAVVSFVRQES